MTFGGKRVYVSGDTEDIPETCAEENRRGVYLHEFAVHAAS